MALAHFVWQIGPPSKQLITITITKNFGSYCNDQQQNPEIFESSFCLRRRLIWITGWLGYHAVEGGGLRSSYEAIWFKTWFQLMCVNFQFAFTQWIALLPKNCFLVFFKATLFCRWKKIQLCQSSYSCFFAKYILYFERLMYVDWSFSRLKICIWLPVQPKKLVFGWEMSKIQPFIFLHFFTLLLQSWRQCALTSP